MPDFLDVDNSPWEPFGGKTKDIFRKSLSAKIFPSGFKVSLTLAKPGGEFPEHEDPYGHIFFILEGKGEAFLEGRKIPFRKGTALTVEAGKRHSYRNTGTDDLLLITLNIFEKGKEK